MDNNNQARIQREAGGRTPPPLRFVREVGSCEEVWWVGEGVQGLCLPCYYQFFLARFARQYFTNIMNIICKHTSEFNVQYWTVILFLYFPSPIMKRIQLTVPCFMKGHFHISCLELHDLTPSRKYSGGGPHISPPRQIYKIKTTMSYVCLCRDACNCTQVPREGFDSNVIMPFSWCVVAVTLPI